MNWSIPTPFMAHVVDETWSKVYEPSEDTFLLIDAVQKDWGFIKSKKPSVCLEVGSGSGMVISALAGQLLNSAVCLSIDINPSACKLTHETAKENSVSIEPICGDLVSPFRLGLIDLVLFNPPYVVTPTEEVTNGEDIVRSWAGGIKGREVIDRFLKSIIPVLSQKGFGYLLLLRENQPEEVKTILRNLGCYCTEVLSRQIRGEFLVVIRFDKMS